LNLQQDESVTKIQTPQKSVLKNTMPDKRPPPYAIDEAWTIGTVGIVAQVKRLELLMDEKFCQ